MAAAANSNSQKTSVSEEIYHRLFKKKRTDETEQKRRRTSTTVMGIRGLDDDTDADLKAGATANMRAVYEMEDRSADRRVIDNIKSQLKATKADAGVQPLQQKIANPPATEDELEGEIELGRKMAAQILGANPTFNNETVINYLNGLAQVIAESGLSSPRPFRIAVLNSEKVNAFACPGGYIFITRGALRSTANEAQLAALIGHEIVHISKRHLVSTLQKKITKGGNKNSQQATDDDYLKARRRVRPDASGETSPLAQILGPKGVGLTLLQASTEALDTLLKGGLEREFELEADALGQQISAAGGYESRSLIELLKTLQSANQGGGNSLSSTHPPYEIRINHLNEFLTKLGGFPAATAAGSSLFGEMQREWSKK
jgi:predicted Zn-dependent protease